MTRRDYPQAAALVTRKEVSTLMAMEGAGATLAEIAAAMGWSKDKARAIIATLRQEGQEAVLMLDARPGHTMEALIRWVWYHRTMDAADSKHEHLRAAVMQARPGHEQRTMARSHSRARDDAHRIMNAARRLVGGLQPFEAIDIAERSCAEGWSAERLEVELPGYTEFAKRADANMPHNKPAPTFDIGVF